MTDSFEARLQRALDRAARQLEVPPAPWPGPTARRRRGRHVERLGVVAGVAVAAIVAALAVSLIGHRHGASMQASGSQSLPLPPAAAFEPNLPAGDLKLILNAWKKTARNDPPCRGDQGPRFTDGSPSRGLRARFAILRQPPNAPPSVQRLLEGPLWSAGAQLYVNQAHVVRTQLGARLYILPAGNVSGQEGVPKRCGPEQVRALSRQVTKLPEAKQAGALAAQSKYLAYLRYAALHPEGICAGWAPSGTSSLAAGDTFGCATTAELDRWGILADASGRLGGTPVFWTVVPDAVAAVTLHFAGRGTPLKHPVTVTVRPLDNVVLAPVPHGKFGARGAWADSFPSRIVLRNHDAKVVRNYAVTPSMTTLCDDC
jgi:hypothetical protein